jgi:hypothetical protein
MHPPQRRPLLPSAFSKTSAVLTSVISILFSPLPYRTIPDSTFPYLTKPHFTSPEIA